jgi:hypothetical protein
MESLLQYFCRIVFSRQSYDVLIEIHHGDGKIYSNTLDLKNPYFRYTGQAPQPPPGTHTTSPSDKIWATMDNNGMVNGMQINGGLVDGVNTLVEMPQSVMGMIPGTMVS